MVKNVNDDKRAKSQAAQRSAARKVAQSQRGSKKFQSGSNSHNGGSRGQSGQQTKR